MSETSDLVLFGENTWYLKQLYKRKRYRYYHETTSYTSFISAEWTKLDSARGRNNKENTTGIYIEQWLYEALTGMENYNGIIYSKNNAVMRWTVNPLKYRNMICPQLYTTMRNSPCLSFPSSLLKYSAEKAGRTKENYAKRVVSYSSYTNFGISTLKRGGSCQICTSMNFKFASEFRQKGESCMNLIFYCSCTAISSTKGV